MPTFALSDEAGGDEVIDGVDQVVELLAGRIALAELRERDAAARAAAVVRVEDGEAARGRHLAGQRVSREPAVGDVRLGPAVHVEDQRHARLWLVERPDEDALQLQAVARLVRDDFLRRHALALEPRVAVRQPLGRRRAGGKREHLRRVARRLGRQRERARLRGARWR